MKKLLLLTLPILFALPNFAHADITTGLQGWWQFNGDTLDYSGSGNNGTAVGSPSYVAGNLYSQAISLNGTSQYVDMRNTNDFSTGSFSVSGWFYCVSTLPTNPGLVIKGTNSGVTVRYEMYVNNTCTNPSVLVADGTASVIVSGSGSIGGFGNWFMVTMVVDRGTQVMSLYVNGVFKNSSSISAIGSVSNSVALRVGNTSDNRRFHGYMQDFRIYNRALSSSDVTQLYAYNPTPPATATLTSFLFHLGAVFQVFKGAGLQI